MGKKEGDVMAFTFKSFEFLEGYSRSDAVRNAISHGSTRLNAVVAFKI